MFPGLFPHGLRGLCWMTGSCLFVSWGCELRLEQATFWASESSCSLQPSGCHSAFLPWGLALEGRVLAAHHSHPCFGKLCVWRGG